MSDNHDGDKVETLDAKTDDQIRARLRALAHEVAERTDAEAAFGLVSRRSDPSATRFLAIAACVLAVVALAVALAPGPDTVRTTDRPQTTDCPSTDGALAPTPTPGGEMNTRLAAPVATAIMLIGACGDDGPTLLARGEDVEIVGEGDGLAGQTLNIDAQEEDGEASGEFQIGDVVNTVLCADTRTDGRVVLVGEVTTPDRDGVVAVGDRNVLVIREGDPDSVTLAGANRGTESCTDVLESIPQDWLDDEGSYLDLEAGSDIETG